MLTIYIPTHNRFKYLQLLLSSLFLELDENPLISTNIIIKIFNNRSTDNTEKYLNSIARPNVSVYNRENNIGGNANIADSINNCETEYLWILGDDDIPHRGLLAQIVHYLSNQKPNLLYLPASWCLDVFETPIPSVSNNLYIQNKNPEEFLKIVGAKLTFISSFVFSYNHYEIFKNINDITVASETSFRHLAFYSPAILSGELLFVVNRVVISASGNSNFTYSLPQSFGIELPNIVRKIFVTKREHCDLIIKNILIAYLPSFLYSIRFRTSKSLDNEIPWKNLQSTLGGYKSFWFFVYPLKYVPKLLALPIVMISRIFR